MREPTSKELQSNRVVILSNQELSILQKFHWSKINSAEEKLNKFQDKYMDKKKTDHYYQKIDELENDYYYHKNSLDLIKSILLIS